MKFYIVREKNDINAVAEYNPETGSFTVLKGSKLSKTISLCKKFLAVKSIEKARQGNTNTNSVLIHDVVFKSPSTAANFVTGVSTNGQITWKDKSGRTFKQVVGEQNEQN